MFTATKSENAQLNRKNIRVSNTTEAAEAIIGSNFNFNHPQLRQTGCSALQLAYVACGRLEGFVGKHLSSDDLAVGSLLVKSAGGLVSDWQGDQKTEETGNIIATNKKLFKELLKKTNQENI